MTLTDTIREALIERFKQTIVEARSHLAGELLTFEQTGVALPMGSFQAAAEAVAKRLRAEEWV